MNLNNPIKSTVPLLPTQKGMLIIYFNTKQGSEFTKSGNFKIVFKEEYQTLAEARHREVQIKKWRREKKEMLIERYKKGIPTKI